VLTATEEANCIQYLGMKAREVWVGYKRDADGRDLEVSVPKKQ